MRWVLEIVPPCDALVAEVDPPSLLLAFCIFLKKSKKHSLPKRHTQIKEDDRNQASRSSRGSLCGKDRRVLIIYFTLISLFHHFSLFQFSIG